MDMNNFEVSCLDLDKDVQQPAGILPVGSNVGRALPAFMLLFRNSLTYRN